MIGDTVISQKCAFIIVTYNSKDDIKECVLSIKTYHPECGIYLIDNNSTDGTKELIQTIENINLTILQVNSGFAGGSNLGIKKALKDNYEYFFLFNPDARIYKKTINSLINLSKIKKGLVGPIIKDFYSGEIQSIGGKFYPIFSYFRIIKKHNNLIKNYVKIDWILGAALLISKEIINKCGYLDENFFPGYFEDNDYRYRIIQSGASVDAIPLQANHDRSSTLNSSVEFQKRNQYTFQKNYKYYVEKWGGSPTQEKYDRPFGKDYPLSFWEFDPVRRQKLRWI